jgi:membrane protease YdiL (CAAX protease family)
MVMYPIASVYPQEVIFRAFFLCRYTAIFGDGWTILLASAATFAYAHILFGNGVAVGLSFLGGLLFAWRYRTTQSLLVSSIEHALYGQLIFTVGLGEFFYHGTLRAAEFLVH